MFDIGFSQLLVILLVALIVIGPQRLPKVARTLGHLFGRMQRYVNDVKADISREMELEELRKMQSSMEEAARSMRDTVERGMSEAGAEIDKVAQSARMSSDPYDDPFADRPPPAEPAPSSAQGELPLEAPQSPAEKRA
jgi:sec-independent protein translocase protein TatB